MHDDLCLLHCHPARHSRAPSAIDVVELQWFVRRELRVLLRGERLILRRVGVHLGRRGRCELLKPPSAVPGTRSCREA